MGDRQCDAKVLFFQNKEEAHSIESSAALQQFMQDFGRTSGWPMAPPRDEETELHQLRLWQIEGMAYIRNHCRHAHMAALETQMQRTEKLGYCELDFVKMLEWVREQAPLIIHVDLSSTTLGPVLAADTHYRNQFETQASHGTYNPAHRITVENTLFGEAYEGCKPFDRVKYGTLNFANNP